MDRKLTTKLMKGLRTDHNGNSMIGRATVVSFALLLLLAPLAPVGAQNSGAGETSTVTFYGHVFGHTLAGPMPANTEAPIGEANYGYGSYHWCAGDVSLNGFVPTPSQESCKDASGNKLALFSTAGFVDVGGPSDFAQQGGYSMLHNERGQTKEILLDTSQSIEATLYMAVDFHAWAAAGGQTDCMLPHPPDVPCFYPYWGWDVGTQADFVVETTLYKATLGEHGGNASDAPPIQEAIESGDAEVVAQGQWGPQQVVTGVPGYPNAHEFNIDLGTPQVDSITKEEDFFLVYSFYSQTSGQEWGIISWRIWAGEFFPPSFNLPVKNAFDVERVIPNFAHGKLAILGVMNTPWGSYDIDSDSVELEIEGPQGPVVPEHIDRFGSFSVAHGGHYLPMNITWIWDYQNEDLQPGDYTITLSAQNYQGSAAGTCTATFTLEAGAGDRLRPGAVEEGVCGFQSASEEFLEGIKQGSEEEAS